VLPPPAALLLTELVPRICRLGFSDSSSFATIFRKLSTKRLMLWQWQAMRSWSRASMAMHTYLGEGRSQGHSSTAARAHGHPSLSPKPPGCPPAKHQPPALANLGRKILYPKYPRDIFRWCWLLPASLLLEKIQLTWDQGCQQHLASPPASLVGIPCPELVFLPREGALGFVRSGLSITSN